MEGSLARNPALALRSAAFKDVAITPAPTRSEEHTSELQSQSNLVCRLLLETNHAAVDVHTAKQDSTPMILFISQIGREMRDREAFQEVDFRAMFAPLAKLAAEIDDTPCILE